MKPSQKIGLFLSYVSTVNATFEWSGIEALYKEMEDKPEAVAELLAFLSPPQFHPEEHDQHGGFEQVFHELTPELKRRFAWNLPLSLVSLLLNDLATGCPQEHFYIQGSP